MKLSICIKQVPDVNAPLQIKDGVLVQDHNRHIMNAYDASALEEALVLREVNGGEVDVVLVGPENGKETIRKALAMGADRGTHILTENSEAEFDSYTYATILASFFEEKETDFIFCGKQSQDTDSGLTGPMLAELLAIPYVSNAVGIKASGSGLSVTRQGDNGREIIDITPKGLITCSNDMNNPRIPNLKGIMQSKKKPVETISLQELGVSEPRQHIKTQVLGYEEKPPRKPGKKYSDEPDTSAREVARLLDTEANVV